jgi:hypothetical protein
MTQMVTLIPGIISAFSAITGIINSVKESKDKLSGADDKVRVAEQIEVELDQKLEIYSEWAGNLVKYSQCLRSYKIIEEEVANLRGIEDRLCAILGVTADEDLTRQYLRQIEEKVTFLRETSKENLDNVDAASILRLADETRRHIDMSRARIDIKDFAYIKDEILRASRGAANLVVTFNARINALIDGLMSVSTS